eukprot:9157489-Alexandrium_andersonii.AAC.2
MPPAAVLLLSSHMSSTGRCACDKPIHPLRSRFVVPDLLVAANRVCQVFCGAKWQDCSRVLPKWSLASSLSHFTVLAIAAAVDCFARNCSEVLG